MPPKAKNIYCLSFTKKKLADFSFLTQWKPTQWIQQHEELDGKESGTWEKLKCVSTLCLFNSQQIGRVWQSNREESSVVRFHIIMTLLWTQKSLLFRPDRLQEPKIPTLPRGSCHKAQGMALPHQQTNYLALTYCCPSAWIHQSQSCYQTRGTAPHCANPRWQIQLRAFIPAESDLVLITWLSDGLILFCVKWGMLTNQRDIISLHPWN